MTINYFMQRCSVKSYLKEKITNLDNRCTEIQLMVSPPYPIYHQIRGMII